MFSLNNDWRTTAGLLLGAFVLAQWSTLLGGMLLVGAAYLVLQAGYRNLRGGALPRRQVKEVYWRGRRIDLEKRPTRMSTVVTAPTFQTILYLVLGTGLAAVAASMLLATI